VQKGKRYLFFLSHSNGGDYTPLTLDEYAFEIERVPDRFDPKSTLVTRLATTVKANLLSSDIDMEIRMRALDLIERVYEKQEYEEVLTKLCSAEQHQLRGKAISILLSNGQVSQFKNAKEYVEREGGLPRERENALAICTIIQNLGLNVGAEELKSLLKSPVEGLQMAAVRVLAKSGDPSCIPDVMAVLDKVFEKQFEYDCLITLSQLSGWKRPTYTEYMENPDKYKREWQDWWRDNSSRFEHTERERQGE
jgi:hypothetical protein